MPSDVTIRPATAADLPGILNIHNHVLHHTTAIWDDTPETLAQRQSWFDQRIAGGFPVIVADRNDSILGFASFGTWRARCGYNATVEHSVHVTAEARGQGVGSALLAELLRIARVQNRHVMLSGISADNEGSLRLHRRFGFHEAGRMNEVGYKFGRWLDLVFMQITF